MAATRFPIRFTGANQAMVVLGITPAGSFVDVLDDRVVVRMGWAFHAVIPRASIVSVAEDHERVMGWGAHGWKGVWLVNGSSSGLVRIEIDPPAHARTIVFAVQLRTLRVAVLDPEGLREALVPSTRRNPDATL